jgi:hypothetical protein
MLFLSLSVCAYAIPRTPTSLVISSGGISVTSVPAKTVVTLTAYVQDAGIPITTGQVNFCDATAAYCTDIHLLGTAQLTSAGTATFKFIPGIGTHLYKAVFLGTNTEPTNSSDVSSLTVTGTYPTTTTIASSGSTGNYTLTATVTGTGAIPTVPTGSISFQDTTNANAVLGTTSLIPGASTFGFVNSSTPATGLNPVDIATGDFNGDGIPDLVITNQNDDATPSTVTILLGNGDGTFTAAASPATGINPLAVAVGDFNSDGKPDLAVANQGSNSVTILLGNGDGTFTAAASPATGTWPESIAVGDFNGDGKVDLAVANNADGTVTILLGNGDGTFTAAASLSIGGIRTNPTSIAVGDFNGDGKQDLVIVAQNHTINIFLGKGDGSFTALAPQPAITAVPSFVAVADFNGDGKQDLGIAGQSIAVLTGNGDGTFTTAWTTTSGDDLGLAVGDFNGDGKADIVTAEFTAPSTLDGYLGNGDGTFTAMPKIPLSGIDPELFAVGDFNGDGSTDAAVTNYRSSSVSVMLSQFTESATATINNISVTGTGTHLVDAVYPGDTNYTGSTSNTVPLIAQTSPTGSIAATPEPSYYSDTFTLTATVTPPSGNTNTPGGTVNFSIDGAVVASNVPLSGGTASTIVPANNTYGIGAHTLSAAYSGDTNFSAATFTDSHTVSLIPTTTSLALYGDAICPSSTPPPAFYYYGQNFYACTAVSNAGNTDTLYAPSPSGELDFDIDGVLNCALFLQTGMPCQGPNPDAGMHQITSVYLGDSVHAGSTSMSLPLGLGVVQDPTSTTMVTSAASAYQGQPVTFTATVTAIAPGNYAPPVGPVSFYDGANLIGTGTLVIDPGGGFFSTASFTTSALAPGQHSITASYAVTLDFLASVSAPSASVMVLPLMALPSTVTLASSLNPAGYGQTVSFTAAITANPPVGNTQPLPSVPATGMVMFYDGATLLSTSNVDPTTGIATFNTSSLPIGTHVITAQYLGDSNYAPGASNTVIEIIHTLYTGPADFTLTIAQNPMVMGIGLVQSTVVTVTPTNGWTNDVALTCPQNLPYESTCTLTQRTIPGGNGTTTLVLSTMSPHDCGSTTPYFTGALRLRLGGAALAGVLLCVLPRRRRVLKLLLLAVICILPGVVGCAGHCTDLGTRPGTYTLPITGTGVGTSTTHTVNLKMQVNL